MSARTKSKWVIPNAQLKAAITTALEANATSLELIQQMEDMKAELHEVAEQIYNGEIAGRHPSAKAIARYDHAVDALARSLNRHPVRTSIGRRVASNEITRISKMSGVVVEVVTHNVCSKLNLPALIAFDKSRGGK